MPHPETDSKQVAIKTTFSSAFSTRPKWIAEVSNWSLATIAMIGIGMAIVSQFLPFNLALQTVLTGIACGVFVTVVKSLIRYFVARAKRGKDQGPTTLTRSQLSKS